MRFITKSKIRTISESWVEITASFSDEVDKGKGRSKYGLFAEKGECCARETSEGTWVPSPADIATPSLAIDNAAVSADICCSSVGSG